MTVPYAEKWLYHRAKGERALKLTDSGGGPVTCTLTGSKPLSEALTEWQSLANASGTLNGTYTFSMSTTTFAITISCTESFTLTFDENLGKTLGFTSGPWAGSTSYTSDAQPTALVELDGLSFNVPEPIEEVRKVELRHGRIDVWTHAYAKTIRVVYDVENVGKWQGYMDSGICASLHRLHQRDGDSSPYSADNLDGYFDVYPYNPKAVSTLGDAEYYVEVELDGVWAEGISSPLGGDPITGSAVAPWEIFEGLKFGHGAVYGLVIEGIAEIFAERDVGVAPSGRTIVPALVIDHSALLGGIMDRRRGLAAGHPLTLQFREVDTNGDPISDIQDLFNIGGAVTTELASDLSPGDAWAATTSSDLTADGWDAPAGHFYIGRQRIEYSGHVGVHTAFQNIVDDTYGRAYEHPASEMIGTMISSVPYYWRGRQATLYAVRVDPFGDNHETDAVTGATMVWKGEIVTHPLLSAGYWTMKARSLDRRLDEPAVMAITGRGTWSDIDDPEVEITDPNWTLIANAFRIDRTGAAAVINAKVSFAPFSGYSAGDRVRLSTLRHDIESAWSTAWTNRNWPGDGTPGPTIGALKFNSDENFYAILKVDGSQHSVWSTTVGWTPNANEQQIRIELQATPKYAFYDVFPIRSYAVEDGAASGTASKLHFCLYAVGALSAGSFTIKIDPPGSPDTVPTTGAILITTETGDRLIQYTSRTQDTDTGTVILTLDPRNALDLEGLKSASAEEHSVKFVFVEPNITPRDAMRKMIMSSGRVGAYKNDATYDAWQREEGYDIAEVDTDSFGEHMSGAEWASLEGDLVLSDEASLVKLYGGILALTQRGLAMRYDADNGDQRIACGPTGFAGPALTGDDVTITSSELVYAGRGRGPLRPDQAMPSPNFIACQLYYGPKKWGAVNNFDGGQYRMHGAERWQLSIYGLDRAAAISAFPGFAHSHFVAAGALQVVFLAVPPWTALDFFDTFRLTIDHHDLRSKDGTRGYDGRARVIGRQFRPSSYETDLACVIDGPVGTFALSPAAQITAWQNDPAAPTVGSWVEVSADYYDLFKYWLDQDGADFRLQAYLPGTAASWANWLEFDTVAIPAACRLTVSARSGAFVPTTSWFLTNTLTATATAEQLEHAHEDDQSHIWS